MKKHIFLTGGTGFIGSHLIKRLLFLKYRVSIMIRKESNTQRLSNLIKEEKINYIYENELVTFFEKNTPDTVIHLATAYKKQHASNDITEMLQWNVQIPTTLAQLCVDNWVENFINTWTFFEYELNSKNIITEETQEKAYNLYASTKLALNQILKFFSQEKDLKVINLKMFSPYWENDNLKLIPILIQKLSKWEEISLINQSLCFTYISDIVDAYIKSLDYFSSMEENYEVFNIASPSTKISKIVEMLEEVSWKKLDLINNTYQETQEASIFCDSDKAKKLLWWKNKVNIKKWLQLTYKYYKNEIS